MGTAAVLWIKMWPCARIIGGRMRQRKEKAGQQWLSHKAETYGQVCEKGHASAMIAQVIEKEAHADGIADLGEGRHAAVGRKAVQTDKAKQQINKQKRAQLLVSAAVTGE